MSETSNNANAGAPVQPSQAHTAAAAHPVGVGRPSASELDTREQEKARPRRLAGPLLASPGPGTPAAAAPAPPDPSTATDPP